MHLYTSIYIYTSMCVQVSVSVCERERGVAYFCTYVYLQVIATMYVTPLSVKQSNGK